jgi:hypothetical protein
VNFRWFSPGLPVSSTNKTDRHDITEILLKVALDTIKPEPYTCLATFCQPEPYSCLATFCQPEPYSCLATFCQPEPYSCLATFCQPEPYSCLATFCQPGAYTFLATFRQPSCRSWSCDLSLVWTTYAINPYHH